MIKQLIKFSLNHIPRPVLAVYALVQSADLIKVVVGYVLVKKGIWITNLVV